MFRRVPRRALLATAAGAAAILHTPHGDKLPIYPTEGPDILLQETPLKLERHIGSLRQSATGIYDDAHSRVQNVVSKWIGVEHAVETRVKSIIATDETLTPAALYIGISTLTGSIITRNRSLFLRFLFPPTFFFLSLHHFLPKTSTNLSDYLGSLEDEYFPGVARIHDVSNAHTAMTWEMIKSGTQDGREKLTNGVVGMVGKVQDATGLKLREGLGWSRETTKVAEKAVEDKSQAIADAVKKGVQDAENAVEKKVDEVKRLV